MSDVSEAFKAMRATFLGDPAFAGMLGGGDSFFFSYPQVSVRNLPLITFILTGLNPQGNVTKTGLYRPSFDMKVVAADFYQCHKIISYLEEEWTVPREHNLSIDSDNFSITQISFGQTVQVGSGKLINTNEPIFQTSTDVSLRVVRRS